MSSSSEPILDKVKKAYSDPTWWYDIRGFFILNLSYRTRLCPQIDFFAQNMGGNHLEVGVGSGTLLRYILETRRARRYPESTIIATDYVATMIESAARKFKNERNISIEQADVTRLRFPDNSFDSVGIANAFHCFSNPQAALKELYRVIKPNGNLVFNVLLHPSGNYLLNIMAEAINAWGKKKGILHQVYGLDEIKDMVLKENFTITHSKVWGNTVNIVARKT